MEWNDSWRDKIPSDVLERLAECRSKATDVIVMATEMHKCNPERTAEECFERMVIWVSNWNSQFEIFEQIDPHWDWYLSRVK